jgi:acyl-homoserine-lactone acylase
VTRRARTPRPFRRAISLAAAGALALTVVPAVATAQEPAPPPRGTDLACPDSPTADFTDIAGSVHAAAIRCLADLGITAGLRGGDRYGPRLAVERGQMASFVGRFVSLATGEALPDGDDAFRDDDGSVHEPAIDGLTALGIVQGRRDGTFGVRASVTRGQMASFVVRALDHIDDGALDGSFPPAGRDAFGDDDGSTHEAAIDKLAALGVVQGFRDGTFRPGAPVTRDQVATFLVRAYDVVLGELDGDPIEDAEFSATIRRTVYGVPHVEAADLGSIAYGMGYAHGADTLCELMDRVMTADGERSRYLGPGAGNANVISDLYHQRLIADGTYDGLDLEPGVSPDSPSAEARASARGYAAGINRYLEDTPADELDSRCGSEPWVRPITAEQYWRVLVTFLSGQLQQAGQVNAAPPAPAAPRFVPTSPVELDEAPEAETVGSNAYAFGSEVTGGGGVLLGNPHYPWNGSLRFYRAHMTIPGELNVVGAALINTPFIGIGHTDRVAWTHTVSTAQRFGFFELRLDPDDPTRYLFDGESVAMERIPVSIEVNQGDGTFATIEHTFYATPFGNLIEAPTAGLPWNTTNAYTFANTLENTRLVDQYLGIYEADDVEEVFDALIDHQATPYNTTATDADGGTLFADAGAIPHVTDSTWQACATSPTALFFRAQRQPMLDGWRSACQWGSDDDAAVPGIFGRDNVPSLFRDDYVTQSNDSHWLTHPEDRIEGKARIFGVERTERSLRTRLGLVQVAERLAGTDGLAGNGVTLQHVQEMLYANRVMGAELVRDDLVAACRDAGSVTVDGNEVDLEEACEVLDAWDTRVDLDSEGAHLFVRFVARGGLRWAVPFDVNDPVNTPNTLATGDARVMEALGRAVRDVEAAGLALDAPWGEVQTDARAGEAIPIHGGPGSIGAFNVITPAGSMPWTSISSGASWVMSVAFTDDGPISEGVLTYSQSPDPASPWHADQTRLYSRKGWDPLLFDPADVRDHAHTTETIAGDG